MIVLMNTPLSPDHQAQIQAVSDRLELALYCLHHELLKKYTTEAEGALLQQTEPTQPLRAKM